MLTTTEIAGFVGAGLAGAAYVPQISHLIRARCSAGISRLAFEVWLLAALLTTSRAIAIHADVFIVLGGIQIVATTFIMFYTARYKDAPCPSHPPQPRRRRSAERRRFLALLRDVLSTAWYERMAPSAARTLQFIPSAVHRIHTTHLRGTR